MHPLRLLPRFRQAYRALPVLAERERWPRAEIEAFQLERLNAIWSHAIVHVPYYRALHRSGRGALPDRFSSLADFRRLVPVLDKSAVRAHPERFLSERAGRGAWTRTGGSTGTPMQVYWGCDAHRASLRAQYRFHALWGLDILDREAYLWGHSAAHGSGWSACGSRLQTPIEDRLRGRLRLSAYHLGRAELKRYLARIAAFRPRSVYGYGSAINLLAREAEMIGFRCDSIKLFRLTGEPAFPHVVERIQRQFGVPAAIEYGSHECGFTASEYPDRVLRVREDRVLAETRPRDDGQHDLILTVLDNPSFPLLRYAIADTTDAPLALPEHGFAALANIAGRNNDFIVTRRGGFLHSSRLDAMFKYRTRAIRRFRVLQRADGALLVTVEVDGPPSAIDRRALALEIGNLAEGYPVEITITDSLPSTTAGKHRLVISALADRVLAGGDGAPGNGNGGGGSGNAGGSGSAGGSAVIAMPAPPASRPHAPGRAHRLRALIERPGLDFVMEAHNGLSARIAAEAGFEAIWASGLAISAALGVRDSNEASWTQILEVLEFMSDATCVPILVDGDTGYGNFNNLRRLVRKLEQRGIAGVCIEDKVFPKTNSFIRGTTQALADIDEFCGRLRAGKEAQRSPDFVIVARVEALIAGWGLDEALRRAEAYSQAGADAILIHSARRDAGEVLAFKREWGERLPVIIVPTKYYSTPTEIFREAGFAAVIWANHLLRACITTMQRTAEQIYHQRSLTDIEDRVAPVSEVFRLQGAPELAEAEKRYLPASTARARAIVLAAPAGRPPAPIEPGGRPLLAHIVSAYRAAGVRDICVVRGHPDQAIDVDGIRTFDSDRTDANGEAAALADAMPALAGRCLISRGDVLFKKFVVEELMELDDDFAVVVDASSTGGGGRGHRSDDRRADHVVCSEPCTRGCFGRPVELVDIGDDLDADAVHGEWMGFLGVSSAGARHLRDILRTSMHDADARATLDMAGLLRRILAAGHRIRVVYTAGGCIDAGGMRDPLAGGSRP